MKNYREVWLDSMMIHELKLETELKDPKTNGKVTFISFISLGTIPLLPYILGILFI